MVHLQSPVAFPSGRPGDPAVSPVERDPEEESSVQQPLSSQPGEALPGIGFRNAKLSP